MAATWNIVRETLANESPMEAASQLLKNTHLWTKVDPATINLASLFDSKTLNTTPYAVCLLLYKNSQRSGATEKLEFDGRGLSPHA